jgi:hypothetical protein
MFLSVGEVGRKIGANPKDITDAFYRGLLRDDIAPIMAGRRMIPESYLPMVEMVLRRLGKLHRQEVSDA